MLLSLNLFDLSLQFNGFPIKKAKHILKIIHEQNDTDFKVYAENSKQEIVAYHLAHNSFYKSLAKNTTELKF